MGRLSALVASYESGAFALACARSVRAEWARMGRAAGELELLVVDDASPSDQTPWLERAAAEGSRVLRRPRRGGYAAAIASALAASRGGPDDALLVLNADVLLLPGSLAALLAALAGDPGLGAVAPRAFADPACALELPPQELPTPASELGAQLASLSPALARARAGRHARTALAAWDARAPYETSMLSGALLALRRAWVERAGGLLDSGYPLYFEDTDLCRRLVAAGARLGMVPEARAVHFWARSTGLGEDFEHRAAARFRVARRRYLERWHGRAAADAVEAGERLLSGAAAQVESFQDLGVADGPPALRLTRPARYALQLGLSPALGLTAGARGEGECWRMAHLAWEWLHPARYYARALERGSLRTLGAWTFEKRAPARTDPDRLDPEEVTRAGPHAAA